MKLLEPMEGLPGRLSVKVDGERRAVVQRPETPRPALQANRDIRITSRALDDGAEDILAGTRAQPLDRVVGKFEAHSRNLSFLEQIDRWHRLAGNGNRRCLGEAGRGCPGEKQKNEKRGGEAHGK